MVNIKLECCRNWLKGLLGYLLHVKYAQLWLNMPTFMHTCISNGLSWREHVRQTTAKATKSLGFLQRTLHYKLPTECASTGVYHINKTMQFWNTPQQFGQPHRIRLIQHLEQRQRQVAHFATRNYNLKDQGCIANICWTNYNMGAKSYMYSHRKWKYQFTIYWLQTPQLLVAPMSITQAHAHVDQHLGWWVQVLLLAIYHHGMKQTTVPPEACTVPSVDSCQQAIQNLDPANFTGY